MFDYSLQGYRVEDIRILFLSKVIRTSPNLHFRTLNKPTDGNVLDLPLPLREGLLYVPGALRLWKACVPQAPQPARFPKVLLPGRHIQDRLESFSH